MSSHFITTVRLLLTAAAILLLASAARADWPHLRGPAYDGVSGETGLADSWPPAGPPRLWTCQLGQGHSGFIVADKRLYTQRQTLGGQYLVCLDPDTGRVLWESRYDWAWQSKGAYPGPYASPTWYREKVYVVSPSGSACCVDGRTGALLWTVNLRDRFAGKGCDFGYAATPLVEAERVILPVGGESSSLVALDAVTGNTVWTAGSDPASYCPALAVTFRGRRCLVGYLQNALLLVDLLTGKVLCRNNLSSGYDEHSAWPLYREPYLLLAGPFRVPAVRLKLVQEAETLTCRPQWTSRELSNDIVSSVLYKGHIYGFDLKQLQASKHRASRGAFKCLDWSTGKLCWSTDQVGHASVLVADSKLLLLNDTGRLILARADPTAYLELARTTVFEDEVCWTPPTLWRGRLYVRSPSQAVCFYVGPLEGTPGNATATTVHVPSHTWRLDSAWLLTREREYPNDTPSRHEMWLWFVACLGLAFGGGLVATALIVLTSRHVFGRRLPATPVFLAGAFLLGLLGPNALSLVLDQCIFTWPASLYAAFHATLLSCRWAEQRRTLRWARLAVLCLVLVCYGYFELCRAVGMFVAWNFLFGFLPAFPLTVMATGAQLRQRWWWAAAWTLLAFAGFFWSCEALLFLKAWMSG